jgi:hypothetical protein
MPMRRSEEGHILLSVTQHRGRSNTEPSAVAVEAFDRIMDDLGRRVVPINPDAWTKRDAAGFGNGIDWGSPESLAATLEAWRPYLRPGDATLDVSGMGRLIREMLVGIMIRDPDVSMAADAEEDAMPAGMRPA